MGAIFYYIMHRMHRMLLATSYIYIRKDRTHKGNMHALWAFELMNQARPEARVGWLEMVGKWPWSMNLNAIAMAQMPLNLSVSNNGPWGLSAIYNLHYIIPKSP